MNGEKERGKKRGRKEINCSVEIRSQSKNTKEVKSFHLCHNFVTV